MSKLYFTHGPMGSQKTTNLLATAYNFEEHGGNILITKPAADTKGDSSLVSRIGLTREVDFLSTPDMDIQEEVRKRRDEIGKINAVLVDEAQFMEPKQIDQLFALAVVDSIPVMAWGLRTDFRSRGFPGSIRLLEIAHVLRESITMCGHGDGCEHRAHLNARRVGGLFVSDGGQVAIDGSEDITYTSLCSVHYIEDVGPVQSV